MVIQTRNEPYSPRVFISYSHDPPEHKDRVLDLSDRLRKEGVDCRVDLYELSPPEGWPHWCAIQIEEAHFVLVVCSQKYLNRFKKREERGKGLGASWEGHIITQELYNSQGRNTKFIPVVFSSEDTEYIPLLLQGATRYDLSHYAEYERLYRHLTNLISPTAPCRNSVRSIRCSAGFCRHYPDASYGRIRAAGTCLTKGIPSSLDATRCSEILRRP